MPAFQPGFTVDLSRDLQLLRASVVEVPDRNRKVSLDGRVLLQLGLRTRTTAAASALSRSTEHAAHATGHATHTARERHAVERELNIGLASRILVAVLAVRRVEVRSTEQLSEQIARIHTAKTETARHATSHTTGHATRTALGHGSIHALFAIHIVHLSLFLVAQHFIRLANILELLLGNLLIILVAVRMPLQCQLSVSLLQLFIRRVTTHTKNRIIILAHEMKNIMPLKGYTAF